MIQGILGKTREQKVERQISALHPDSMEQLGYKHYDGLRATHRDGHGGFSHSQEKVIKDPAHVIMETKLKIMLGFYCRLLFNRK